MNVEREPHQHSEESQDALINQLWSMLSSPSLTKFAAQAREYMPPETLENPEDLEEPSTSTGRYSTRSRVAATSAPFSPPRTTVTRLGHTYHVTDPQYLPQQAFQWENNAPLIHIPDELTSSRTAAEDSNVSVADIEYVHFKEGLRTGTINTADTRKNDPDYYLRKKDDEESKDEYRRKVPERELHQLLDELAQNPIPGFQLHLEEAEKTVYPTRSRCKSLEQNLNSVHPSPSPSPAKTQPPTASPFRLRSTHRPPSNPSDPSDPSGLRGVVPPRTRAQQAKTPQKTSVGVKQLGEGLKKQLGEGFKKPLPVGEALSNRMKIVPSVNSKWHQSDHEGKEDLPSLPEGIKTFEMSADIKERFKTVGVKFEKFSKAVGFSEEEKVFVQQMLAKAVNGPDEEGRPTNNRPSTNDAKDAVVLAEYVMRVVELVSGERSLLQVQPYFESAKKIHFAFTCLVLGVLVADESPLLFELTPTLYGKTRLLKRMWTEMKVMEGKEGVQTFNTFDTFDLFNMVMRMNGVNDRVDVTTAVAVRLGITGREGLLDSSAFRFLEEETIYNPEEFFFGEGAPTDPPSASKEKSPHPRLYPHPHPHPHPHPGVSAEKTTTKPLKTPKVLDRELIKRYLGHDFGHLAEAQSDGSNSSLSSMHAFTPSGDVTPLMSFGSPTPLTHTPHSAHAPHVSAFVGVSVSDVGGPSASRPRRIPLITTALTCSPLKQPTFDDDPMREAKILESRKNSLRSAAQRLLI